MINKFLFWNIWSIKSQKYFESLIDMKKKNHYSYMLCFYPFQSPTLLEDYRRKLGMSSAQVNCVTEIWVFSYDDW